MQFSFSFGTQAVVQSSSIYTYVLQPLRAGTLTIKPVRAEFEGQVKQSKPIEITVSGGTRQAGGVPDTTGPADANRASDAAAARADARADAHAEGRTDARAGARADANNGTLDKAVVDSTAFLRGVVDKAQPYEGEQVTVTLYLYVRERLQAAPNIQTEPATDGLWTHDLLGPNQQPRPERQMVGNAVYAVYVLRRFAAFPLHSGDVTVGPMKLELDQSSMFDLFGGGQARPNLQRASAPLTLRVKPLPEQGRPAGDVAVGHYQLSAKLDRTQAAIGDALTLTVIVEGQGNIRTVQLRPPSIPGVDVLQPELKDLVEAPKDVVGGRREYRFLLVARTPGRISIPPLTLTTFDPRTERYEQRASQPLSFEAVGQAASAASSAREPQPDSATPAPADKAHTWGPIRTQSALQRGYQRVVERRFYPFAVIAPFLIWLCLTSAAGIRRRLALRAQSGHLRVLRGAEQRLRSAEQAAQAGDAARFYAHANAAVVGVLDARLEEPVTGLTRVQLRSLLEARGMEPALMSAVLQALQDCEYARFGSVPLSSAELDSQARALQGFFKQLAAWKPKLDGQTTVAA
jgi:hypothetical protein